MKSNKLTTLETLERIEDRFKGVVSGIGDMSKYPLKVTDDVQFATDKDKSRVYAEVFTPLHIVDEMLDIVPQMSMSTRNLDLCSGYGQFSIRILRKLYTVHGEKLKLGAYLSNQHFFSELQVSSCYKLLCIFSPSINLFIGDALQLGKLPKKAKGIWFYLEDLGEWVDVTRLVGTLFYRASKGKKNTRWSADQETFFVNAFDKITTKLSNVCREYKMNIKEISRTKEGRAGILKLISDKLVGAGMNWQGITTPEDIVREMVRCVPDVTSLKRILVLFNIEFLECLIKELGIDPSCVTMISDTKLEAMYAEKIYGVHSNVIVEHTLEGLKAATVGCEGYDVIFSNPPYQIQSDSQKGRSDTGAIQAKPIYHDIVMYAIDFLKPRYLCMITPSRWMVGGMGLGAYRTRMLADKSLKIIQDFPGTYDVFKDVGGIAGGVSYFLWDRDYSGLCEFNGIPRNIGEFDVVVRDSLSAQILKKVLTRHPKDQFCNNRILPKKPFGIPTNFTDFVSKDTLGAVKCYVGKKLGFEQYINSNAFSDLHNCKKLWKVMVPSVRSQGSIIAKEDRGEPSPVCGTPFCADMDSVCAETYIVIGSFNSPEEQKNYEQYVKTRFYRFMLSLRIISQDVNKEKFAWVPDLGDYNHVYTDKDLYTHFGLTKKEIEHIEKSIKTIK